MRTGRRITTASLLVLATDALLVGWGPSALVLVRATRDFDGPAGLMPQVVLETEGVILHDTDVRGVLRCSAGCPPDAGFDTAVEVEYRGRTSRILPKRSMSIETFAHPLDGAHDTRQDVSLLGMPAHDRWVLHGPYLDHTLVRNALSFDLAAATGQWAPRARFVELFVAQGAATLLHQPAQQGQGAQAGEYMGVYLLCEKPSAGLARVPLGRDGALLEAHNVVSDSNWEMLCNATPGCRDAPPPTAGSALSSLQNLAGAFTGWFSRSTRALLGRHTRTVEIGPTAFEIKLPRGQEAADAAAVWVDKYLRDTDDAVLAQTGNEGCGLTRAGWFGAPAASGGCAEERGGRWRELLDSGSLVDYVLHAELIQNGDAYISSTYMSLASESGPLRFGPVWDANIAMGNDQKLPSTAAGLSGRGSGLRFADPPTLSLSRVARWIHALYQERGFRAELQRRWRALRAGAWRDEALVAMVRRRAAEIGPDAARDNAERWPPAQVWSGIPQVRPKSYAGSWAQEVAFLESWLRRRAAWLDANL
ncbi:unnamed protein product [Pedinophyceae sp. YPF-701]|nr:unnamed protein product [Pedinophyceae sp. YPF-701]